MTEIKINVLTTRGNLELTFNKGKSLVIVGANGSGKTRLGVHIDQNLTNSNIEVHRVGAHRSLTLNPAVVPPSFEAATNRIRFGNDTGEVRHKTAYRWQQKPEIALLNDFDHLVAALYAENNDVSISYRDQQIVAPTANAPPKAIIDKLQEIWQSVLPHRELVIMSGNLKTRTFGEAHQEYSSSDMSDGERVIFYLIAQALLAKLNAVLIFDEPELHLNKAIIGQLWDAIESSRSDCTFVYITHDVDFASSRRAASKYVIRAYVPSPNLHWDIEKVADDDGIPADILTKILGSRKAILFVEGDAGSLDAMLYRRAYGQFTVLPVGSCDQVIHTVKSFQARADLHRFGCAGLVDADGRSNEDIEALKAKAVYCLPVTEVENILLLPRVFVSIALELKFSEIDAQAKLQSMREIVSQKARADVDGIALRQTKRTIDSRMKKVGLSGTGIDQLEARYREAMNSIDPRVVFLDFKTKLESAIKQDNYEEILRFYDNKGLLSEMASLLGYNQKNLEEFVGRSLKADESNDLYQSLSSYLPVVTALPVI
jgi:ABC-type cobalamin/Fe3+-siderophores transport system ATPase subunit